MWDYFGHHEFLEYRMLFTQTPEILFVDSEMKWIQDNYGGNIDYIIQKAANHLPSEYGSGYGWDMIIWKKQVAFKLICVRIDVRR